MSATQRSESMNAFFNRYINSMTCLQQFVHQYDNALQHKAELECEAHFTCKKIFGLSENGPMLKGSILGCTKII